MNQNKKIIFVNDIIQNYFKDMEDKKDKDVVYSKNVVEFITVANEYCMFTEKAENYTKEDIIHYMLKICPLLYLKGALLPASNESEFEITERYVNEEHWDTVYKALNKVLGKDDIYFTLGFNDTGEHTPVMASIADNLTDIYQDLKDFLMLYQKGTHAAKENAVAECRSLFEKHWGKRLVNAHCALHNLVFKEERHDDFYESEN